MVKGVSQKGDVAAFGIEDKADRHLVKGGRRLKAGFGRDGVEVGGQIDFHIFDLNALADFGHNHAILRHAHILHHSPGRFRRRDKFAIGCLQRGGNRVKVHMILMVVGDTHRIQTVKFPGVDHMRVEAHPVQFFSTAGAAHPAVGIVRKNTGTRIQINREHRSGLGF